MKEKMQVPRAEGENDDLDGWRRDHRRYFERNLGFDSEVMLVCERFKVVHDFSSQLVFKE